MLHSLFKSPRITVYYSSDVHRLVVTGKLLTLRALDPTPIRRIIDASALVRAVARMEHTPADHKAAEDIEGGFRARSAFQARADGYALIHGEMGTDDPKAYYRVSDDTYGVWGYWTDTPALGRYVRRFKDWETAYGGANWLTTVAAKCKEAIKNHHEELVVKKAAAAQEEEAKVLTAVKPRTLGWAPISVEDVICLKRLGTHEIEYYNLAWYPVGDQLSMNWSYRARPKTPAEKNITIKTPVWAEHTVGSVEVTMHYARPQQAKETFDAVWASMNGG